MLINLSNINKTYKTITGVTYRALSGITTSFDSRGLVFLIGRSGSGKTTLMNIIGGLDNFDSGSMTIAGEPSRNMSQSKIDSFRNTVCGYIFQDFNLIETLNVFDNVRIALQMQGNQDTKRVHEILEQVGLKDKELSRVKNLSGGQRQRVAIARALIKEPKIILADEPTGALDTATGEEVMKMLKKLSSERLVIVVTHDMEKAYEYGDRIVELKDGKIYRDVRKLEDGELAEESVGVSFYGESLVKVDSNCQLTDADVDKINEAIMLRGQKTFVNIDDNRNKIKALFPNLREAIEQDEVIVKKQSSASDMTLDSQSRATASVSAPNPGTANEITSNSAVSDVMVESTASLASKAAVEIVQPSISDEKFVPYKAKETVTERITYKKSRVPITKTLQLGLNYLNHKKVMLVFAIVLAVTAFVLLAFSQSITFFNMSDGITGTIKEEKFTNVSIKYGDGSSVKQFDIDAFQKSYPKMSFHKQYDIKFTLSGREGHTGVEMKGFVEVKDLGSLKLNMIAGNSSNIGANEIIITDKTATRLINKNYAPTGVKNPQDLLGKQLIINDDAEYKVIGICKSEETIGYNESHHDDTGYMRVYVAEGYLSKILDTASVKVNKVLITAAQGTSEYNFSQATVSLYEQGMAQSVNSDGISAGGALSDSNSIYISRGLANAFWGSGLSLSNAAEINAFNAHANEINLYSNEDVALFVAKNVQIKGILEGGKYYREQNIILDSSHSKVLSNALIKSPLLLSTFDKAGVTGNFIKDAYSAGFVVANSYVSSYNNMIGMLEFISNVLIGFTMILALLVVILLYNFIATSIQLTKKQIGILRALGARKADTFLIYIMEGLMVMIFSFVVATALVLIFAPILNALLSTQMGYYFSLFNIRFGALLMIFGMALAITLIAVGINIKKFNKITPVEAINSK